jgi:hypothetical protein
VQSQAAHGTGDVDSTFGLDLGKYRAGGAVDPVFGLDLSKYRAAPKRGEIDPVTGLDLSEFAEPKASAPAEQHRPGEIDPVTGLDLSKYAQADQQAPQRQQQPAPGPSSWGDMAQQFGVGVGRGVTGLANALIPPNPFSSNEGPAPPIFGARVPDIESNPPAPKDFQGRVARRVGEFVPGLALGGGGGVARQLLPMLGGAVGSQALEDVAPESLKGTAAMVGGAAGGGLSVAAQRRAGLFGNAPPLTGEFTQKPFAPGVNPEEMPEPAGPTSSTGVGGPTFPVKTAADAKAVAGAFCKAADAAGGTLTPAFTNRFIDEIGKVAPQTGAGQLVAGETPVAALVRRMNEGAGDLPPLRDQPLSLQAAQEIDEALGN